MTARRLASQHIPIDVDLAGEQSWQLVSTPFPGVQSVLHDVLDPNLGNLPVSERYEMIPQWPESRYAPCIRELVLSEAPSTPMGVEDPRLWRWLEMARPDTKSDFDPIDDLEDMRSEVGFDRVIGGGSRSGHLAVVYR
jgi:hypothetical protein